MRIISKLGFTILLFATVSTVQARNFSAGSVELFGTSAAVIGTSKNKDPGSDSKQSYTGVQLLALYYIAPNFGLGIDYYHTVSKYSSGGFTDTYTNDIWSPTIAFNLSMSESSGLIFGATKTGLLKGESKSTFSDGTTFKSKYSGRLLFAHFRHYMNPNAAFTAGLEVDNAVFESDSGSRSEHESTNFVFGFVLGFAK